MATSRLQLQVHRDQPGATLIEAHGELDLATAVKLREELLTAVATAVTVLDAAGLRFCDSTGLRVLAEAHQAAQHHGTSFRLAAPSPALTRVLALAGADHVFSTYPDTRAALRDSV